MLYAIIAEDHKNSLNARLATRPDHIARLLVLQEAGRLMLAGPCPAIDNPDPGPAGFSGSIIIAEFDSLADAQTWANNDPYVVQGVYKNVIVKPFHKALPA